MLPIGGNGGRRHLLNKLTLPILPVGMNLALAADAMQKALDERRGVVIEGERGVGKTIGIATARRQILADERAARDADKDHRARRVVVTRGLGGKTEADALISLLKVVAEKGFRERAHAMRKDATDLMKQLVTHLRSQNVGLLVVDEAQRCSDAAITMLRNLIADGEETDDERYGDAAADPNDLGTLTTAGVGLVVAGTPGLRARIEATGEARHRWVAEVELHRLPAADVPGVYAAWFPRFREHVSRVGEDVWRAYVTSTAAKEGDVPFRFLENHAKAYWYRMINFDPSVTKREAVYFLPELFESTLAESRWSRDNLGPDGEGAE
jgi:hypothetical protein